MKISENLKEFISEQDWIFAKTYAETWPHEYIVQERVENDMFLKLANYIDKYGYEDYFYNTKQIYFDYNGFTYWNMDNIINRCRKEETYSNRKKENRLPDYKGK